MPVFYPSVLLRWLGLAAGFGLVPFAAAQGIEFRVLSWHGPVKGLFYENEGKSISLSAAENGLSRPYTLSGGTVLKLYREEKRDGKIERLPAATLPLPPALKRAILVLEPSAVDKRGYAGLWIDDSPESRPVNHLEFVNLSHVSLAIRAGGENLRLLPRESSHPLPFDLAVHSIPLKVAANPGSGWMVVSSEPQAVHAGLRILILFRDGRADSDGNRSLVDFVKLYDYVPPPAAPK